VDVATVLSRIATVVNGADLAGNTLGVNATHFMPSAPDVPAFYPFHWRGVYDRDYGGLAEMTMTWHLLLSRAEDENASEEASALAGTGVETIYTAVHAARKTGTGGKYAGGVADDIVIRAVEGPRQFEFGPGGGGPAFWGIEFTIFGMG